MNINSTTWSTKKVLLSASTLIIFAGTIFAIFEKTGVIDIIKSEPAPYSGPSEAEKAKQMKAQQEDKKDFIETPDPVITPQPEPAGTIELSARQESNGSVTVLTKLNNAPNGSCELTVTNAGKTHAQTASIIYQPSFSSCAGFSVSKDKLGAGSWTIHLSVTSDTSIEKSIVMEVK